MLQEFKREILSEIGLIDQQEVRHVAQIIPPLDMNPKERKTAVAILTGTSKI